LAAAMSRYLMHAAAVLIVISLAGYSTVNSAGGSTPPPTATTQVAAAGLARDGGWIGPASLSRYGVIQQPIAIPGQPAALHAPVHYTVRSQDDLASIAARSGLSIDDVLWSNPGLQATGRVVGGMDLVLPPVPGLVVVVRPGDTIASIAATYHVSPQLLADFNYLRTQSPIQPGQLLVAPGGLGPALFQVPGNPFAHACRPSLQQTYGPTSLYLEPSLKGYSHFHTGIDLSCSAGTPIHSVTEGLAHVTLGWGGGFGNNVVVEVRTRLPGDLALHRYFVRYGHLERVAVADGATIHPGQVIGHEGSTGNSTGPHLHFEVDRDANDISHSVNPAPLLDLA
jgi:LysM repeat protein